MRRRIRSILLALLGVWLTLAQATTPGGYGGRRVLPMQMSKSVGTAPAAAAQ